MNPETEMYMRIGFYMTIMSALGAPIMALDAWANWPGLFAWAFIGCTGLWIMNAVMGISQTVKHIRFNRASKRFDQHHTETMKLMEGHAWNTTAMEHHAEQADAELEEMKRNI